MIREVVTNIAGFNINDVLDTDYESLIKILCSEPNKNKKEVMSLEQFVQSI
ncbi:hypothetical protein [Carnobacterium divergens]|uniref:hypothetical protein n=1 Tax=Carnobacterium divergens TaxID=2748 RepID=UPI0014304314|nr:hypothetical protein [Carnobacterium divergens]